MKAAEPFCLRRKDVGLMHVGTDEDVRFYADIYRALIRYDYSMTITLVVYFALTRLPLAASFGPDSMYRLRKATAQGSQSCRITCRTHVVPVTRTP